MVRWYGTGEGLTPWPSGVWDFWDLGFLRGFGGPGVNMFLLFEGFSRLMFDDFLKWFSFDHQVWSNTINDEQVVSFMIFVDWNESDWLEGLFFRWGNWFLKLHASFFWCGWEDCKQWQVDKASLWTYYCCTSKKRNWQSVWEANRHDLTPPLPLVKVTARMPLHFQATKKSLHLSVASWVGEHPESSIVSKLALGILAHLVSWQFKVPPPPLGGVALGGYLKFPWLSDDDWGVLHHLRNASYL